MRVDIWSDIMCPFCYIGKRKLETALAGFEHKEEVEIVWHSFQLDPAMQPVPGRDVYSYLAERKGQSREWSVALHNQMEQNAKRDGLTYNFSKAVVANSYNAHRLIQLAKKHGLGDAAEERLFSAYFTEGKDVGDANTLLQLGIDMGLNAVEVGEMLSSNAFADEVQADVERARELGVNGVPFFVIDDRYGISGAQPAEVFSGALRQAWSEQVQQLKQYPTRSEEDCTDGSCAL